MRRRLDHQTEEYLRERIRRWLADDARNTAGKLAGQAGVSEGHLSNFLGKHRGLGVAAAEGLAKAWGITWEVMVEQSKAWAQEHPVPAPSPTVPPESAVGPVASGRLYRDLPGWEEAAAAAVHHERAPVYAVEAAGLGVVSWVVGAMSEDFVVDEALRWLKHAPLDVRRTAETEQAQRENTAKLLKSGVVPVDPLAPGSAESKDVT